MEKTMLVAGIVNIAGTSKKTGRPFSMFKLTVLEPAVIQGFTANSIGYVARELDCEEQVLNQLNQENFPVKCDAFLDMDRDNKVRISSVRISKAASSVKAAS